MSPAAIVAARRNFPPPPIPDSLVAQTLANVAREAHETRAWWIDETPPATIVVLTNGSWYYVVGDEIVLARGEAVLACIEALPLLLGAPEALYDALVASRSVGIGA